MMSDARSSTRANPCSDPPRRKVLVLGLDGATFDLLRPWMEEGALPSLERLARQGTTGELRSVVPPLSSVAWPSFATGKNPGKHGLFDFVFPRPNSYGLSIAGSGANASATIWDILSENDRKVGIVGVPMTYPPSEVNGFLLSSFMTPGPESDFTFPASLKSELSSRGFHYRTALRENHRSGDVQKFLDEVALSTEQRVATALYLLQQKEWDLFCFVFLSPDLLQHDLWHLLDPQHPQHDPLEADKYRDAIRGFYSRLEHHITQLIGAAGKDTLVILLSDHGFGRATHFFHVNRWLLREGYLVRRRSIASTLKYLLFRLGITPVNTFRALISLHLGWLRQHVRFGRMYKQASYLYFSFNDIDWSRTRAFSVGNWGQIYINVKGQRPQGIVEPGTELEDLRNEITERLLDLRDPSTSERVVQQVIRSGDLYSGDCRALGPDLIPMTKDLEYVAFGTLDFGSNLVTEPAYGLTGHHRMNGILIMSGKEVRSGATLLDPEITDVAPTILYAMGVPIPRDMDGKVLFDAFTPAFVAAHAPTYIDSPSSSKAWRPSYSAEDEERVRDRLKGMGYMA